MVNLGDISQVFIYTFHLRLSCDIFPNNDIYTGIYREMGTFLPILTPILAPGLKGAKIFLPNNGKAPLFISSFYRVEWIQKCIKQNCHFFTSLFENLLFGCLTISHNLSHTWVMTVHSNKLLYLLKKIRFSKKYLIQTLTNRFVIKMQKKSLDFINFLRSYSQMTLYDSN